MFRSLSIVAFLASLAFAAPVEATETRESGGLNAVQAVLAANPALDTQMTEAGRWGRSVAGERRRTVSPPTKLAIIACRVEGGPEAKGQLTAEPDWALPVECMRVLETVTDATALNHLWLRQMTPNLAHYGTCAEVAMNYAPIWEASHRNWLIVKVGCPTRIVDADGKVIGWHMPECQGTLPGTDYPLRCRFDPSEI